MAKNLVIVESPAKAKTIEKYLGKDFIVKSSVGHIRSIAKKAKKGTEPIAIKDGYRTLYEIDSDKKKVIADLKQAVSKAETVWLATDEDREGEAIAWHLCEVLKLDPTTTRRIVFHEITKSAIEEAIKQPRTVDMNLVQAQQARQILDRIVGFELSPVVWQKVPGGKSAGRVQSPAVRLLVEREREIEEFKGSFSFKVKAEFESKGETILADLPHRFQTEAEAQTFLESIKDASFAIRDVATTPGTRNPGAPFTTSSLQQEANAKLGFSAKATMAAAQKLYQAGKITYMRTDSVNLSKQSLTQMTSYITGTYGKEYHQLRTFKTKSASAQEAHEAIRPTDVSVEVASQDNYDQKLYDLIRRRTLASQMSPAKIEKTTIIINTPSSDKQFEASGEVVIFDGFLKIYTSSRKEDRILPTVTTGDELHLQSATAKQLFAKPPARYTEGSLVKKLEELGIGRPSTYATIINTVQVRGYAEKGQSDGEERDIIQLELIDNSIARNIVREKSGADKNKLVPTTSGRVLTDFLSNHFNQVVDYGFTAHVESEFDDIANGTLERNDMLDEFYKPFHELIEKSGDIDRSSVAQARELGVDPKTNLPVFARFGRFGPMLQLGETSKDKDADKPKFAPLPKGARLETVTLENALEMFKLPRLVGQTDDGQDIKANIGRFGPYIQVGKLFVSIKPHDPFEITEEVAKELYAEKLEKEANKYIKRFTNGIDIINGPYGPYITDGKKNARIPKTTEATTLTEEECSDLLAKAPDKKKRNFKKKTSKK